MCMRPEPSLRGVQGRNKASDGNPVRNQGDLLKLSNNSLLSPRVLRSSLLAADGAQRLTSRSAQIATACLSEGLSHRLDCQLSSYGWAICRCGTMWDLSATAW